LTKKGYKFLVIETGYWRPNTNYVKIIADSVKHRIRDGDFVTISEKALATASGNILDETNFHTSLLASLIARYWMRYVWGYFLSVICHLKEKTVQCLRRYPVIEGSVHKQVALTFADLGQALMHGSEGGIDGSNLPYSFVSLPLENAQQIAKLIHENLKTKFGKNVNIMIVDTDKTYSFKNFHFTPRPKSIKGIHSCNGFIAYIVGRFFKLKQCATPIAQAGAEISIEETLKIAELANRARGFGAGRNVWDMAEAFGVDLTKVTWKMLNCIKHKPIVIVRKE
jgi:F420-0:gamma-glutamyl ligase-like protein